MKRIALILSILANGLFLFAQSLESDIHKQLMIENINNGYLEKAADEITHVADWTFDDNNEKAIVDINNALAFVNYIDSIGMSLLFRDSMLLYVADECDFFIKYFYSVSAYRDAIPYVELKLAIAKELHGENHPDYARSLNNLGLLYDNMGDYAKAELYYLQALEIRRKTIGENHPDYARTLNNLASLYDNMSDYAKAESYYLQALEIYRTTIGENHPNYAGVLYNIGILYDNMSDYAKAETYFLQALEIYRKTLGENHPDYAASLNNLGLLYVSMGDYAKAEACYLQALEIYRKAIGENHPDYAELLFNIGSLCVQMGDHVKAEIYYLHALEIRRKTLGENHPDYARSLHNLGVLYAEMGDYKKAESHYLQALESLRKTIGENHPDYAGLLYNLGILYVHMGNHKKAETYWLQALEIRRKTIGENHPDYAESLNAVGNVYAEMGDYIKAENYYLQALEISRKSLGYNHSRNASLLNNLGSLYIYMGDYTKAEFYYLQALEIREKSVGVNHPDYAGALIALGNVYADVGNYVKAETNYLQAMEIYRKTLGENHLDYAISLHNLGFLYVKTDEYTKAEPYYYTEQIIHKEHFLRSIDFMSENQREHYWETMRDYFEYSFPTFVYKYINPIPSVYFFAYNNELFTKGLLLESSNNIHRSILESNDTTLIQQWNELTSKKQQILTIEEKDSQSGYLSQLKKEEAEQLEKEVTRKSAIFRQSKEQWNITWDSVRNHLGNDHVAIEYMVAPLNEDSTMYCALLLRNNSQYPEFIPLFEEKEVSSLINTTSENQTSFTYSFDGNGAPLQKYVWSKVLPYINPGETIYFAPSGLLHQLVIEALPYDSVHTMADMFNLVRLSSTREIVLNKAAAQHSSATLYGGIQYNMTGDELLAESEQYATSNLLASRGIEDDELDRGSVKYLPGTKKEVESINQMLHDNNLSVKLYTSTTANEESFKAISGKHQNILHIATHGFYWADSTAQKKDYFSQRMLMMDDHQPTKPTIDPLNRCGLLFAGANTALTGHSADLPEGVQDGILTAKEISLLDLRDADFVVLSACETGKGEITGEGVFGLQRAFKQAGAQTIIMSLWPVNDAATQLLMTEFYRNWITNRQSKREAFRNAQNTVRSQYEEPVYWAGFVMLD